MDADYLKDLADLVLRLLHVVAGIAWIGASFYFIRLDLGLRPPEDAADAERGVAGEYWGVHGGGFYHSQKYKVAPPALPEHLHWFKWEAYTTWLSGFALLVVLYWLDADTRLVDPAVADLSTWQAVAISAAGLALAWLAYDAACRVLRDDRAVAVAVAVLVTLSAFAAGELFAARAAFLQVGAMLGTIMAANVFFVIIPAHWELVRAKQQGREPDPAPGLRAKQRSVHNNYLTLPVVFTMLAGHFPLAFGQRPRLARPARDLRARRRDPALLQPLARRQAPLVDPRRGDGRSGRAGDRARAGGRAETARRSPTPTRRAIVSARCAACHVGASAPPGVAARLTGRDARECAGIERRSRRTRCRPATPPG